MSSQTHTDGEDIERARQELFSAVDADDSERVRQLFATTSLQASDATEALDNVTPCKQLDLTRCLLEHGALPSAYLGFNHVRSLSVLKLFVEFGYDIASTGHLIIQ